MSHRRRERNGARSLHVRGYDVANTGDRELREIFESFGPVLDVYLPKDYFTKELRGFAYIQFAQDSDAEEARRKLDRTDIFKDGREIHIMWAAGERKTPVDMRRLDILRDNPHARRMRQAQGDWPRSPPRGGHKRYRSPSPRHDRRYRDRSPFRRGGYRRGRSRSPYRRDFRSPPRHGRRSRSRSPHRRRHGSPPSSYRRHSPRHRRDERSPFGRSPGRESSRSPHTTRRGDSRSPYRRGGSRSPPPKRRVASRSPRPRSVSPTRRNDSRDRPNGVDESLERAHHTSNGNHSSNPANHHEAGDHDATNGEPTMDEESKHEAKGESAGNNFPSS